MIAEPGRDRLRPTVESQEMVPYELILGIDTCGAEGTLALARLRDGRCVLERESRLAPRAAGTQLTAAIAELLQAEPREALRAVVVVRGPGSFTGMRIGLSAAKALAEALEVPLFGVSRLEVLAWRHRGETSATASVAEVPSAVESTDRLPGSLSGLVPGLVPASVPGLVFAVALDAGRGRVYLRVPGHAVTRPAAGEPAPDELLLEAGELRAMLGAEEQAGMLTCEEKVLALFPMARRVQAPTAADAIGYAAPRIAKALHGNAAGLRQSDGGQGQRPGQGQGPGPGPGPGQDQGPGPDQGQGQDPDDGDVVTHAGDADDVETLDALYLWRPEQMLGVPRAEAARRASSETAREGHEG
jgi:tRNA threonylcarbamoyladenosine biosynthesis protein TsaB